MTKEKIELADVHKYNYPDDWDGYVTIEETQDSFDGEKGFVDMIVIFQRLSDSKYFRVNYCNYGRGESDFLEQTAVEVTKKQKTIDYFE